MADFNITALGRTSQFQRCLACFQTNNESKENLLLWSQPMIGENIYIQNLTMNIKYKAIFN